MHVAYARDMGATGGGAFRASFPPDAAPSPLPPQPDAAPATRYGERSRPNVSAIATVIAIHAVVLVGLVKADVIPLHKKAPPLLVVDLIVEPPAPPPPPASPEPQVKQIQPVRAVVVSPPPIVATPTAPPPVAVVAEAPPPQAVVVAPAPRAVAVSAPASVDLSSKMVSGKPPQYPTESRRKREQGIVVLRVTVAADGGVADVGVAQGSGFDRLDKAALVAVRRWRWSPTIVGGEPVQVRGLVRIPFELRD